MDFAMNQVNKVKLLFYFLIDFFKGKMNKVKVSMNSFLN